MAKEMKWEEIEPQFLTHMATLRCLRFSPSKANNAAKDMNLRTEDYSNTAGLSLFELANRCE